MIIKQSYLLDPRASNNIIMLKKVCLPVLEYVAEIYQTMITTPRQELKQLAEELLQQVPEPMHSMLEKESREDAIQKHKSRKMKETVICPPTCTGKRASIYSTSAYIQLDPKNSTNSLIDIDDYYLCFI